MPVLRPNLLALVQPWLLPAQRVDVRPLSADDAPGIAKFAGSPARPSDAPWPTCSACEAFLDFVAQFPAQGKFWRLFVCESCCPWSDEERRQGLVALEHGPLSDAQLPGQDPPAPSMWEPHAWILTDVLSPPLESDLEFITPPDEYVAWLEEQGSQEEAEDDETARVFASWGAWAGVQSQIGGYAHFIQSSPQLNPCPECGQALSLLARLDSEDDVGIMWGDLGAVYLHACPDHPHVHHYELQCF